jgi:hypothetical protein
MKKAIALLTFVLAAGTIAQAQGAAKISFFECQPSLTQKLRLLAGADKKEMMNIMASNGQCALVTDLSFENIPQALSDSNGKGLLSVDELPGYDWERVYCDGEDAACMKAEAVDRMDEIDVTMLFLNPMQIQTLSAIAAEGIAKKLEKKSVYFISEKDKKNVDFGEGGDGKRTSFDLRNADLLIK